MTALQRSKIKDTTTLTGAAASLLTNAAGEKVYIRAILLFNSSAAAEQVRLYNVPDVAGVAGVAAAANQILEYGMAAKESFLFELPYPVILADTGDSLQGYASTASVVTYTLLGDKDA